MKIDAINQRIIGLLEEDARRSNRDVARLIEVSEATVRSRIRKLEQAGAIRFSVLRDPEDAGLTTGAFLRLVVSMPQMQSVMDYLVACNETFLVAATSGSYNIVAFLLATDDEALREFVCDEIAALAGVREVDVRKNVRALKYDWRVVRVSPPAEEAS